MLSRRNFLNQLVAAGVASAIPVNLFAKPLPWRNWSGLQVCYPKNRSAPQSITELQDLVKNTPGVIRPVGAGHSFSALVPTDDTLISLSRLSGLVETDTQTNQATILAGSRLGDIGAPLAEHGQALLNMPDIDEQTVAGAIATATHGTGQSLGCLSSFVKSVQMVKADGDLIECSANHNADLFKAAQVNLGALGIVTQVKLQNTQPYRLKRETAWLPIEDILDNAEDLAQNNRNFEFYYIPFTGMGFTDTQNITQEPASSSDKVDQNEGAEDLRLARDLLAWSPKLRELVLSTYIKTLPKEITVANSWQNYATERNVRFNEMEYHLPRDNMVAAFKEVRNIVERNFPEVFMPFEIRYVKSDDAWLSPFNGRESCSIAVHRYFKEDQGPLFKAVEPIFRKYQGRPHWGKFNTGSKLEFAQHYHHWSDFTEVRQQLDPAGKFLNPYLKSLFG